MKLKTTHYFVILIILVIGGLVVARYWSSVQPGKYDQFAQCLVDEGATFYGAFWCPHCQEQKRLFGNSAEFLPYVECSTEDKQSQTEVCNEAGIRTYPTWDFADGKRIEGVVPLQKLAEATGCELTTDAGS